MTFHVPEHARVLTGRMASTAEFGCNGAFILKINGYRMALIASDQLGWEHVSASFPSRCPSWEEMCKVKAMFWDPQDVVIQYHPAESEYVNCHPFTLHLWRPVGIVLPTPPKILVGI